MESEFLRRTFAKCINRGRKEGGGDGITRSEAMIKRRDFVRISRVVYERERTGQSPPLETPTIKCTWPGCRHCCCASGKVKSYPTKTLKTRREGDVLLITFL